MNSSMTTDSNKLYLSSMMYGTRQYINSKWSVKNEQACYKKYKYNTILRILRTLNTFCHLT